MIAVYLTYGTEVEIHRGGETFAEDKVVRVIHAGEEQHLIDCADEEQAALVVGSWLLDPDTIAVRTIRLTA